MNDLEKIIIEKIKKDGPISFETFMDMALYYPELGYYSSPETTIGKAGDFYTSPHLHPVFGAMVARQLMEMWTFMQKPSEFRAVEMGAGIGYLCKDIFDYLNSPSSDPALSDDKNDFLSSLRYVIVEPFSHFEECQKKLLKDLIENSKSPLIKRGHRGVSWAGSLNEVSGMKGCILSNELLDAFPVRLIEMDNGLKEIHVNFNGKKFTEEKTDAGKGESNDYIKDFAIDLPQGYRTEVNLKMKEWINKAASVMRSGFILTVDYGYSAKEYYNEERSSGTLLCYHKHLFNEEPYQNIGKQDITAHINFSALKKWGEGHGLKTVGYCPQGTFLTSAGIDEVITELYAGSKDYLSEISKIKGLIMPQGMGESHNFMVQYKGKGMPELRGFSMRNLMENL